MYVKIFSDLYESDFLIIIWCREFIEPETSTSIIFFFRPHGRVTLFQEFVELNL